MKMVQIRISRSGSYLIGFGIPWLDLDKTKVCCICLARFADNDELRELPCAHFFHMECVDKWLKINALCPLCKCEVGERSEASPSVENPSQHHGERVPNGAAGG